MLSLSFLPAGSTPTLAMGMPSVTSAMLTYWSQAAWNAALQPLCSLHLILLPFRTIHFDQGSRPERQAPYGAKQWPGERLNNTALLQTMSDMHGPLTQQDAAAFLQYMPQDNLSTDEAEQVRSAVLPCGIVPVRSMPCSLAASLQHCCRHPAGRDANE